MIKYQAKTYTVSNPNIYLFLQNKNESRIVYSLRLCPLKIGTNNFARLFVAVPIPNKTG